MSSCGFPGAPAHSSVEFSDRAANAAMAAGALGSTILTVSEGTIAEYTCDRGFELLGPARRVCANNGTWSPQGIPFCGKNKSYNVHYSCWTGVSVRPLKSHQWVP